MAVQDYKLSLSGRLNVCNVICFSYKYVELRSSFCSLRDAERYRLYHLRTSSRVFFCSLWCIWISERFLGFWGVGMAESINAMSWRNEVWFTAGAGIFPLPTKPRLVLNVLLCNPNFGEAVESRSWLCNIMQCRRPRIRHRSCIIVNPLYVSGHYLPRGLIFTNSTFFSCNTLFDSYGSQNECWSFTCTPLKIKVGKGRPVRASGGTEEE